MTMRMLSVRAEMVSRAIPWLGDTPSLQRYFKDCVDEPIPTAEPIPAGDTVAVKRNSAEILLRWIADANLALDGKWSQYKPKSVIDDCVEELRAALGEKGECKHNREDITAITHDGLIASSVVCKCGMTRTLGEWSEPEKTKWPQKSSRSWSASSSWRGMKIKTW